MASRDGGSLFWQDFENRVVAHVTDEHEAVKRAREEAQHWKDRHEKQRRTLCKARFAPHGGNMDDLVLCDSCEDFFIESENNEDQFMCECGVTLCGQETEKHLCAPCMCSKCEDNMECMFCMTFCDACDAMVCSDCMAPNSDELVVECDCGEHGKAYCSVECKNKK